MAESMADNTAISNTVLLTGAGFTANFGGYLADEMWSLIFNNPAVQRRPRVRRQMLSTFDYEEIYHTIIYAEPENTPAQEGAWGDDDKEAIRDAIAGAYEKLDSVIRNHQDPDDINLLNRFRDRFSFDNSTDSYFFTLNQDLFVERRRGSANKNIALPGVKTAPSVGDSFRDKRSLESEDFLILPDAHFIQQERLSSLPKCEHHYVKLHGSWNWKSADGSDAMVIGYNKQKQIEAEPLLEWYFDIFKSVLLQPRCKLMIVGYGFRDPHINAVIAAAIKESGLKIYVISPEKPREFIGDTVKLLNTGWSDIVAGLAGYYPARFLEALRKGPDGVFFTDFFG